MKRARVLSVLLAVETSLGQGEDDAGRLIHQIHCESANVIYKGSAILWQVEKITIK
jgi:hypothetical protein